MCNFEFLQVIIAFFSKTVWPRNMKFGLHRVSIWVNIQKKFQVPGSHSIGEKCDANFKLSSHFSRKLCDRGTWNLVCIEYPYGLIYKKNFKFLGRTVSEKNAMLTCKISKLFIRANVQLWIFAKLSSHFSRKLCDRGTWNLVCIEYPYGLIYKKNFKFLGRTVSEKNAMLISSLFECRIIAFFSKTVWPRNMKFGLHRVSIWVNIQKKFQVPGSHSIGEKCDANL